MHIVTARPVPRLGRATGVTIAALALAAVGALLAAIMRSTAVVRWDGAAATWLHTHTTPAGLRFFTVLTSLGSPVAWAIALLTIVALARSRDYALVQAWLVVFGGGELAETGVKAVVHRVRPPYGAEYLYFHSYSFPSGHAVGSVLCYGMLAYTLLARWEPARRHRALVWLGATFVVALVAVSRTYLGVHFPSDVLGGILFGTAWLAFWIAIMAPCGASTSAT